MICTPASLLAAARCFSCLREKEIRKIETYLLCLNDNVGGFGRNLVPPNSTYQGTTPTFTLTVLVNTSYVIVWGANDLSMTLGGVTYTSPGVGQMTTVFTKGNTQMVFTGTFSGTTVTAIVRVAPASAIPIPSGFTFTMNAAGTQATASWDGPPSVVTSTEVWTSSDGVSYSLISTVAAATTSAVLTAPAVGSTLYCKIRWKNSTTTGAFVTPLSVPQSVVSAWANRVVTNLGAAPSAATVSAINTFWNSIISAGLDSLMICVNVVAPDSVTAARTPLIVGPGGNNQWRTPGDLAPAAGALAGLNGWYDNSGGANNLLRTGISPKNIFTASSGGFSVYCSVVNTTNTNQVAGSNDAANANLCAFHIDYSGVSPHAETSYMFSLANQTSHQENLAPGFFSANRTSPTAHTDYYAKSTVPLKSLSSEANVCPGCSTTAEFVFGGLNNNGTYAQSGKTHSFWALHAGLTQTQVGSLYNAVQALRTAFGGGFV